MDDEQAFVEIQSMLSSSVLRWCALIVGAVTVCAGLLYAFGVGACYLRLEGTGSALDVCYLRGSVTLGELLQDFSVAQEVETNVGAEFPTEEQLLKAVGQAERELKVFVYEIPAGLQNLCYEPAANGTVTVDTRSGACPCSL
jgi:hypothetical protein